MNRSPAAWAAFAGALLVPWAIATSALATPGPGWYADDGTAACLDCCGTCGEWESYAVFDTLLMQRDNAATNTPLVYDNVTSLPVIGVGDMQFTTTPGVRAFYGQHGADGVGWEVGYLGVYGMFADAAATGPGNLDIAPFVSSVASFSNASAARTTWSSVLNMAEANLMLTGCRVTVPRRSAYSGHRYGHECTADWLTGFRWAGLEDQARISLATPGLAAPSTYAVRSTSNLFGIQIGGRGRIEWERWAVEGWAKAAVARVELSQSQAPIVDAISGEQYRTARGSRSNDVGGIFDLSGSLVRRLNETWSLRAGYTMIWLTSVALGPDQFNFAADTRAGTTVVGEKTVWLQGGSLGLEARW